MSSTSQLDDTLSFLREAPTLRRGARWDVPTLELTLRLCELSVFLMVGIVVGAGLADAVSALVASTAATVAGIEAGRLARRRGRVAALALQVLAAGAVGAACLMLAGLGWRAGLEWAGREAVGSALLLAVCHALYDAGIHRLLAEGRLATHVAVLGNGPLAAGLAKQFAIGDGSAIRLVGHYAADETGRGMPVRGTLRTLLSDCRRDLIDAVVLAPEPGDEVALAVMRQALRPCTQTVYLAPELKTDATPAISIGGIELGMLGRRPLAGREAMAKRAFDVLGSLVLLGIMLPLLTLLSVIIKLDTRGPVLFRQLRVGTNNRLFYIFKFRSMHVDLSDRLAKQQTVLGDTRITRVGRVIRRLSFDELPQLLNVLRGDMSLVGPRPHAPGTSVGGQRVHTIVDDYACRHLVRPGITGLAQVRGLRGGLQDRHQVAARVAADLEYIERWSLWLDVRILGGTVLKEMRKSRGV